MNFKEFLKITRQWSIYQTYFVEDALGDSNFPDARSLEEILAYLPSRADGGMENQARYVWKKYLAALNTACPA